MIRLTCVFILMCKVGLVTSQMKSSKWNEHRNQLTTIQTYTGDKSDSLMAVIDSEISSLLQLKADSSEWLIGQLLYERCYLGYRASKYQEAISDAQKALPLAKKFKDAKLLFRLHYQMGNCYAKIGSGFSDLALEDEKKGYLQSARNYLIEAERIAKDLQDTTLITQSLAGMANLYLSAGQYDSTEVYAQELIQGSRPTDYKNRSMAFNYLGIIHYEGKKYQQAVIAFQMAIDNAKNVTGSLTLLSAMGNLSAALMELEQYELSKKQLLELIDLNKAAGRKQNVSKNYINLYKIYKHQKKYDSALLAYENYYAYRDSVLSDKHRADLLALQVINDTQQKENEITQLQLQNVQQEVANRQTTVWIIAVATCLLLFVSAMLARQFYRNIRQKERMSALKHQLLTAQMNPHFLFNSLNSIQRLYIDGRIEEGNLMMSRFAQFMRDILDKTGRNEIPLYEEADFIASYLKLEKNRLGEKFDYEIVISDELRNDLIYVPPLISQPLVENALLHGILPKGTKGHLKVSFYVSDAKLTIQVEDDGVGLQAKPQVKINNHISKGITLITERLGKYGHLKLAENECKPGTCATLTLPINQ